MTSSRESRTVDEIFASLAEMSFAMVVAHDEVPRELPGFASHDSDFARGLAAAHGFARLAAERHALVKAALDAGSLSVDDLARVRHDLRAQIQAVKGYAEMVLEEMRDARETSLLLRGAFARIVDTSLRTIPHVDRLTFQALCPADLYDTTVERQTYELIESAYDPEVGYEDRYQGCRVLIIDDSEPNRDVLSRRLRRAGLDVRVAATGDEGLAIVAEESMHLVLCDVLMPGMDGYEVLRRLKADDRLRDVPVLMVSALREDETIVRCIEAGADDYLPTPIRTTILHARIKACLNRKLLLDKEREHTQALAEAREELISAIESMSDGFAIWGRDDRVRIYNEAFRRTYPFVDSLPKSGFALEEFSLAAIEHSLADAPDATPEDRVRAAVGLHRSDEPHLLHLRDGRTIEVTSHRTPHDAVVSVHKDVTSRKRNEERLRYLAMHDPLTALSNRATFDQKLAEATATQARFALLFVDLDRFKDVNDTLGHDAGDRLLIQIADAIRSVVRVGDLVARVGGDEFAILLLDPNELGVVSHVASRVLHAIGTSYEENGRSVAYGATIGIALHPEDSGDPPSAETLLQHADIAMYAAKRQGKGRHVFYGSPASSAS